MGEWDEWTARIRRAFEALQDADYYAVLGVGRDADPKSIRQAYYRRAGQLHPDRLVGAPEPGKSLADTIFKRVSEAYQTVGDPALREAYDRTLAQGEKRLTVTSRFSIRPKEQGWFLKTEGGRKHWKAACEALEAGNGPMASLNLQIALKYEGPLPELKELEQQIAGAGRARSKGK